MRLFPYLFRCGLFLSAVLLACGLIFSPLLAALLANPLFNATILGVLLVGVLYSLRQMIMLRPEIRWLEAMRIRSSDPKDQQEPLHAPRLLGPLARILKDHTSRLALSPQALRSLLDGLRSRIDESHETTRYVIGLLVFLGLLGTFWGLLETVRSVGLSVAALDFSADKDPIQLFSSFQASLQVPLQGMGTAFSSSLFGLAGALILGFLELQAGQAHNRFLHCLEEWLSSATHLSSSGGLDADSSVPAYIQALLEQTAENLNQLQETIGQRENTHQSLERSLSALGEQVGAFGSTMVDQKEFLRESGELQKRLLYLLEQKQGGDLSSNDEERQQLQSVDRRLETVIEEMRRSRTALSDLVRHEMRLLARTFAAIRPFSGSSKEGS